MNRSTKIMAPPPGSTPRPGHEEARLPPGLGNQGVHPTGAQASEGFDLRQNGITLFGTQISWNEVGGYVMQGALLGLLVRTLRRGKQARAEGAGASGRPPDPEQVPTSI
jgi:hypothetical protein